MTTFVPATPQLMANFQARLHLPETDHIRFSLINQELLVEGTVGSYDTKCKIDRVAHAAGLHVQNCVRVIPGVAFTPSTRPVSEV
jgi:hypothetical protein